MDANIQRYIDAATAEILDPQFESTKQFLEVNEVAFEDGKPKVERVDVDPADDFVSVYFCFKDEEYFLVIYLTKLPEINVHWVNTENSNEVCFTATSEDMTLEELSAYLPFGPLTGWSKGDEKRPGRPYYYDFSRVMYKPFKSHACDMEPRIELLLTELEKYSEDIKRLAEKTTAYIDVTRHQYVSGNAQLFFDIKMMERLVKLNLSVNIYTYIVGNEIKD